MGRKRVWVPQSYWREQPRWYRNYHTEWSGVVGDRIRRMRRAHELTLIDLRARVERPDGGAYSESYFSRLERGASSPPLYVYLTIAKVFDLHPGRLLGPDDAERDASPEEMTLLRFMRRGGISPDAALHILANQPAPPDEEPAPLDAVDRVLRARKKLSDEPQRPPHQEIVRERRELRRLDFGQTD